jgi:hypothetical protein
VSTEHDDIDTNTGGENRMNNEQRRIVEQFVGDIRLVGHFHADDRQLAIGYRNGGVLVAMYSHPLNEETPISRTWIRPEDARDAAALLDDAADHAENPLPTLDG